MQTKHNEKSAALGFIFLQSFKSHLAAHALAKDISHKAAAPSMQHQVGVIGIWVGASAIVVCSNKPR